MYHFESGEDVFWGGKQINADLLSQPDISLSNIRNLPPAVFMTDSPLRLIFETVHPEAAQHSFVIAQIGPGRQAYVATEIDYSRNLHKHGCYELMFVIEGCVYQNIEHKRHFYPTGSCCLLNRNVYHIEEYHENYRVVFIQFTSEFITELISVNTLFPNTKDSAYDRLKQFFTQDLDPNFNAVKDYMDFIPVETGEWTDKNIHPAFESILKEFLNPTVMSDLKVRYIFLNLLCLLFDDRHFIYKPVHLGSSAEQELFDKITHYIQRKHGRVSRSELETVFNYSGDYIYKIIQKYTGLSIFEYRMSFCLAEAAEQLKETSVSISQIALQLGFSNLTHFYKLFKKKYHMTPREYRNLHKLQKNR